ncbi:MAG: oxidase [Gemmatimonadetes bacterium]|jgi:alkyldihydroxyacetonephosphate synthase|nr:oxidase [Gemmatimonadota bacterium]
MKSDAFYDPRDGERYVHKWGYADTRFEFDGPRAVRVTGDRYKISGFRMPYLIPFVEEIIKLPISQDDLIEEWVSYDLPDQVSNEPFVADVRAALKAEQIASDAENRLAHSHGQLSVDEIFRVLTGGSFTRLIDVVVFPESEDDVRAIVKAGVDHDVCLIPFGGGTNVSGALAVPEDEARMICSVDMRRMNRILWVDKENNLACIESGIQGKELELRLEEQGLTSGHDPDSIEFSTLGGWISTNASGMKKNRYGNIEDIVLEATLVTPKGELETKSVTPRNSTGVQPRSLLFGSEGNFGIITKAVMKVHLLPEARDYGSLVFPTFRHGVDYLRALRETGTIPASIRLVNNTEFRMGQALKPEHSFWGGVMSSVQKTVLGLKGFKLDKMAACTFLIEGTYEEVAHQKKTIFRVAKQYRAVSGGASNGKRGYALTFGIAYIRDFVSQLGIMGETFETSVPWSRIQDVCDAVTEELDRQVERLGIQGRPYFTYRVTQTYHTGVCIYFTLAFSGKGLDDPAAVYHEAETHLRQAILDNGGSLSHHHGVGKLRAGFLDQVQSDTSSEVLRETKNAMDPANIFGARNGVLAKTRNQAGHA